MFSVVRVSLQTTNLSDLFDCFFNHKKRGVKSSCFLVSVPLSYLSFYRWLVNVRTVILLVFLESQKQQKVTSGIEKT